MSNHTRGPWIFYADLPSTEPNWHIVTTENKMRVIANVHIEPGNSTDEANARLISAAPDLLEALKVCATLINIQNGNIHQDVNAILNMAKAAVDKAEDTAP